MRAHVNAKHSIGKDGPNSPNVAIDLESIFIDSNSAETAKVGGNLHSVLQSNDITGCYRSSELTKLADNVLENTEIKNVRIHNKKKYSQLTKERKKIIFIFRRTYARKRDYP